MSVFLDDGDVRILNGDVQAMLATLPSDSAHCVITSPPYWGLRDYGVDGQLGLEPTPQAFLDRMTAVFREVRRVLRADGTCWLNIGDSYNAATSASRKPSENVDVGYWQEAGTMGDRRVDFPGLKPKDLCGIPWRLALALQDDGWYLRADVIWSKPNPMPESVTDRPTKAHEYVFLLTKSARYFYDADAIREKAEAKPQNRYTAVKDQPSASARARQGGQNPTCQGGTFTHRNARTVWEIATEPYPEAHFATYPTELVRRCLLAGCPEGGTVLDPFLGSGTTAYVARHHQRNCIGIELNPAYCQLAAKRLAQLSLLSAA